MKRVNTLLCTVFAALFNTQLQAEAIMIDPGDEEATDSSVFVIASGSEGGKYQHTAQQVAASIVLQARKRDLALTSRVINTNGSLENIELLNDADVQAALVQADVLNIRPPSLPITSKSAYQEHVMWVYNIEHGFDDLEDIEGSDSLLMVIVEDSGADITMQSFVAEDLGYKINYDKAVFVDDLYDAFDLVAEGRHQGQKIAGLLYVGGQIPAEISADFKGSVAVGSATHSDFNDATDIAGEPLYSNCEIGKTQAQGLLEGWGHPIRCA